MVNQQFAFALHTLSILAVNTNGAMTSEFIAASVNTNPVVIRRLLSKLSKSSLVETQLGKNGGVRLKKAPSEITLKDIYESLYEKSLISASAKEANKKCPISCKMKQITQDIIDHTEQATIKYLESVTLSDIQKQLL